MTVKRGDIFIFQHIFRLYPIHQLQRRKIAPFAKAADLSLAHGSNHGGVAKFLSLMNVGQMHLHRRQADRRNGVPDGIAVMGVGSGINHDSVLGAVGLMDPVDQRSLMVGLKNFKLNPQLLGIL